MGDRRELSEVDLVGIAAGDVGTPALEGLGTWQNSRRRLLLLALRGAAAPLRSSDLDDAFSLLAAVDRQAPAVVDAVIGRSLTRAWAMRCLRGIERHGPADPTVAADVGFLGAMAAAAAVRAGLDFEIRVPAPGGEVYLPGLGTIHGLGDGTGVIRGKGDRVEITGTVATISVGSPDGWSPVHAVTIGSTDAWSIEVEDHDPYRDCFHWRPADRLADADLARFATLLAQAWELITRDYPGYASIMRQTLRTVVPLASDAADGIAISASAPAAYGSVAVSLPPDPANLAMLLIHEVQHMTLGAVYDMVDLCRADGEARHHAPWRMDPRPVPALLQGAFAHLGVTDFWRLRRRFGGDAPRAEFEFAYWHELTTRAVATLAASGELTPAGARFVEVMAATLHSWWAEPVPVAVTAAVLEMAEANAVMWRLRNQRPAEGSVRELSRLRVAGAPAVSAAGVGFADAVVEPGPPAPARRSGLADHLRRRLLSQPEARDLSAADGAYLRGDLAAAGAGYRDQIAARPMADDAWVGLAAVMRGLDGGPAAQVLARRPDLVRALYLDGRSDQVAPAPEEIARWLAATSAGSGAGPSGQGDGGSM